MIAKDPNAEIDRDVAGDGQEEQDLEKFKEAAGFVLRAPRRRPLLATAVFLVVGALGVTVAVTMPRTYNAQVRLLAQRNLVLPALSNPGRAVPHDADNPTRNVADMILRRDNLIALAKEANLVERFYGTRSAALRLKDWVFALVFGPPLEGDRLLGLVQTLEKKIVVNADENTVTISVDWPDPQMAYELASLVQKNFVEARYDSDVSMIQDAIGVLEDHAKAELEQVDSALGTLQSLQADLAPAVPGGGAQVLRAAPGGAPRDPSAFATPAAGAGPTQAAASASPDADLTRALEEQRRRIRALEDERLRDLDRLKQQLVQAQLTLTPMHPTVMALQQKVDALSQPSPELAKLKTEEQALMAQIAPASPSSAANSLAQPHFAAARPQLAGSQRPVDAESQREDPTLAPARSKLESAIHRYQDNMARLEGARLELDITRAAFRYRYSIVTPPEVPRSPKKPIAPLVAILSLLFAAILAPLSAAAADWFAGRVLEPWQVRRRLKIDVLGELEPPL